MSQKGFTLIEILVAIVLLVVITSIAVKTMETTSALSSKGIFVNEKINKCKCECI